MLDVIKFIDLVGDMRSMQILKSDKAAEYEKKVDKAVMEYREARMTDK